MHRLIDCRACFCKLFWYHIGSMRNHFFSVVDPECVFGFGIQEVFSQETTLLLGPEEDAEMRSEANSEWAGLAWFRRGDRSCCPTRCLAVVISFAHFWFRAFLKRRSFVTPEVQRNYGVVSLLLKRKYHTNGYDAGKLEGYRIHTTHSSFSGGRYNVYMCMCVVVYNNWFCRF